MATKQPCPIYKLFEQAYQKRHKALQDMYDMTEKAARGWQFEQKEYRLLEIRAKHWQTVITDLETLINPQNLPALSYVNHSDSPTAAIT